MFSTSCITKVVAAAATLSVFSVVLASVAARGETVLRSRGEDARVGNWVGAPLVQQKNQNPTVSDVARIKIIERAGDQQSCRNTLFVPARPRKCPGDSASPEITNGDNTAQASNSSVQETVVRNPESAAVKIKTPADKPPLPKSVARLNVEGPERVRPKLIVTTKVAEPDAREGDEPKPPPLLSCGKAGTVLGGYGFNDIKPSDCAGGVYSFNASRDGKSFVVTLNSASGELIQVRKMP